MWPRSDAAIAAAAAGDASGVCAGVSLGSLLAEQVVKCLGRLGLGGCRGSPVSHSSSSGCSVSLACDKKGKCRQLGITGRTAVKRLGNMTGAERVW